MRRAAKIDLTHGAIADHFRKIGFGVHSTAGVGRDFPDLVITYRRFAALVECKSNGRKLTKGQERFRAEWDGPVIVAYTPEQAEADYWAARQDFIREAR